MEWASVNTSTPTVNEYTMLDSFVYDEYATTEIEKLILYIKVINSGRSFSKTNVV